MGGGIFAVRGSSSGARSEYQKSRTLAGERLPGAGGVRQRRSGTDAGTDRTQGGTGSRHYAPPAENAGDAWIRPAGAAQAIQPGAQGVGPGLPRNRANEPAIRRTADSAVAGGPGERSGQ